MVECGYTLCSHGRVTMKDAGLRIRLEPELRDEFLQTCHDKHVPAAQVLREFMRHYVATNKATTAAKSTSRTASKKTAA